MKIIFLFGVLMVKSIQSQIKLKAAATCEPILFDINYEPYDSIIPVRPLDELKTYSEGEQYTFGYAHVQEFRSCAILRFKANEYDGTPIVQLECLEQQSAVSLEPGELWKNDGKWRTEFRVRCGSDGKWHLDTPLAPGAPETVIKIECIDPVKLGWKGWDAGCGLLPPLQPASVQLEQTSEERDPDCTDYDTNGFCFKTYASGPVCGSNGAWFASECEICKHNARQGDTVKVALDGICAEEEQSQDDDALSVPLPLMWDENDV